MTRAQYYCPLCQDENFSLLAIMESGELCPVHRGFYRRWKRAGLRPLQDKGGAWVADVLAAQLVDRRH